MDPSGLAFHSLICRICQKLRRMCKQVWRCRGRRLCKVHKSRAFSSAAARQINGQELSLLQKKMTSFSHYPLLSLQDLEALAWVAVFFIECVCASSFWKPHSCYRRRCVICPSVCASFKVFQFFLAALNLIPNDKSLKTGFVWLPLSLVSRQRGSLTWFSQSSET